MRIDTIQANRLNLELCIDAIKDWCASRRLQLNGDKTEIIWFGSRAYLNKLSSVDTTLLIESFIVEPVNSVRNLGVYTDSALSMHTHIDKVSAAAFTIYSVSANYTMLCQNLQCSGLSHLSC